MMNRNIITAVSIACYFVIIAICESKKARVGAMPSSWPDQWNTGIIPFVFDYYSSNLKRLINMVLKGVKFIEEQGCLVFEERSPIEMAQLRNTTYLYYTYSGVLEECCGIYFNKNIGRRLVLITPLCRNPPEIVHATLHALGLVHGRDSRFSPVAVKAALYPDGCLNNFADAVHDRDPTQYKLLGMNESNVGTYTRKPGAKMEFSYNSHK